MKNYNQSELDHPIFKATKAQSLIYDALCLLALEQNPVKVTQRTIVELDPVTINKSLKELARMGMITIIANGSNRNQGNRYLVDMNFKLKFPYDGFNVNFIKWIDVFWVRTKPCGPHEHAFQGE